MNIYCRNNNWFHFVVIERYLQKLNYFFFPLLDDLELLVVFSNDMFLLICLLELFHFVISSNILALSSLKVFVSVDRFPISVSNFSNLLLLRSRAPSIVLSRRIMSILTLSTSSFNFSILWDSIVSLSPAQFKLMCFWKIIHLNY